MLRLYCVKSAYLSRLVTDKVDLIKPVSNVRTYVRMSVRPQKVSLISMTFGLYVEVDE